MDSAAAETTLPQEKKEPVNHKSQIFVGTCNRTIALNVNLASDSVEDVKRLIEEREGIPVSEQHLTFGGKPLRDCTSHGDYEELEDESTINVIPRIPGGYRNGDMALSAFLQELKGMTCDASIPGKQPQDATTVKVLSAPGRKILHGVLTCILSAHRAGLAFNGAFEFGKKDDAGNLINLLRVQVYEGPMAKVVSTVYVHQSSWPSLVSLDGESQKADYGALKQVIRAMFPSFPLDIQHVGSILELLEVLTGDDDGDDIFRDYSVPEKLKRSTHLLQAYAAMVSSPVAVSTMCLNLKRFYEQLHGDDKPKFADAMRAAQAITRLADEVEKQPMFKEVYDYTPSQNNNNNNNTTAAGTGTGGNNNVPDNQYAGDRTGMEMFNFARNWFVHQPEHRWDGNTECFKELSELDYIFTYHFPYFIPQALLQLYYKCRDCDVDLLTRFLVSDGYISTEPRCHSQPIATLPITCK